MRVCLQLLCIGVCLAGSVADAGRPTSRVSIIHDLAVDPIVVVSYPWKVHSRPSIEIQLLTDEKADAPKPRPIYFVKRYLKGEVTVNLYRCHDRSDGLPTESSFTEDETDFTILGQRNSLGRPSVCVGFRNADPKARKPVVGAAFCLLRSWAINRRLLYLDLPKDYFAKPGKIRVWFLREGKVLWTETADLSAHTPGRSSR